MTGRGAPSGELVAAVLTLVRAIAGICGESKQVVVWCGRRGRRRRKRVAGEERMGARWWGGGEKGAGGAGLTGAHMPGDMLGPSEGRLADWTL